MSGMGTGERGQSRVGGHTVVGSSNSNKFGSSVCVAQFLTPHIKTPTAANFLSKSILGAHISFSCILTGAAPVCGLINFRIICTLPLWSPMQNYMLCESVHDYV